MNKEQIEQLALELAEELGEAYSMFDKEFVLDPIQFATCFLARVDAERAKEGPAAWAVLSEVEGFNFIAQWPEACHEHINDYYTQCLENGDEIEKCSVIALYTHPQPGSPEGYKLVPLELTKAHAENYLGRKLLNMDKVWFSVASRDYKAIIEAASEVKP